MAGEENPLIAGILAGIVTLLIGWALGSTPSPLQPVGIMIFIFGIAILAACIYGVSRIERG